MVKLAKYLKPFLGGLIVAIALLFVQAMADLALPDYMSNIVNKGIQQGGIENAVPEAIREEQMKKVLFFMTDEEKQLIESNYELITKESVNYDKLIKKYPALKEGNIFVKKDIKKDEMQEMDSTMAKALLSVYGVEQIKANPKDGMIELNGKKLPANIDLYAMLKKMPSSEIIKLRQEMNKKFEALGEKMLVQAAAPMVKAEYKALGMDTEKLQSNYIIRAGLYMLLIALLGALCTIIVSFLSAKIAAGLARNLRKEIFSKVQSFSNTEFDKFSTASLITRTTNDITQIQMLIVIMIRMVIYAPIMGVGGVIRALDKSASMSWIIALAVVLLLGLITTVFSIALPKFKLVQKLVDKLNLVTRENLSGMMVIRAFNTEHFEEERFDKANTDLTRNSLFINRVFAFMMPIMMFIMNGVTLLIVWIGAHQIAKSSMQVGDMMAFMQYAMQILFSFLMLSAMFIMIPRASVSGQRIAEVLETTTDISDPVNPKSLGENIKGIVEFKGVSFKYPGAEEDILKDINFKALPGQTTAFIGSTGSGKTTLVNLIPRFYDVTNGQILIDGIDIREITQRELRSKIGYIPQKGSLFSGTIESNLKYADENATEEELMKAAKIAQATEFIKERPEGLKGEISQGGTNVSGGQKQRLSIARAIVKKPRIYIFDDSFSALDYKTDTALRRELKDSTKNSTVLIIAQRISTIKNAEQIIVLDEGQIVGMGTHRELMEKCQTYQEIALSQLSKEELA